MKKVLLTVVVAMLLASCTANSNVNIDEPEPKEPVTDNEPEEYADSEQERYTGEIIVDGFYRGRIYFLPDKETKQLIKEHYGRNIDDSIPLNYKNTAIEAQLPKELGIYKAEVMADFSQEGWLIPLNEIELTDNIGTVEYDGKEYETNDLDETVRAKDRVCGLIVSNIRRFEDGGVIIEFEGEIESEGFYSVYPGGEFFNYLRIGRIIPDEKSMNNFPSYLGNYNNFSVYFAETNELYHQLADFSTIGKGKFKTTGYSITYNHGGGAPPDETLTEIISLDDKYKGLFKFGDNIRTSPLTNETNKYRGGFMNRYAIIYEGAVGYIDNPDNGKFENNYYFFGKEEASKIKILSSDEFYYGLKENKSGNDDIFELVTDASSKNPHSLSFRYFDKNRSGNGKDSVIKNYSYGYFKNGDETVRVFEGDMISGMKAVDINVEYDCTQDYPEELIRVRCSFSGETTLTGKLTLYYDKGYEYNMVYFVADDEGIKKLPIYIDNIREQGGIVFNYEELKELLGTEPFEKKCEITINNYSIYKAATEASDTAKLISVNFLE